MWRLLKKIVQRVRYLSNTIKIFWKMWIHIIYKEKYSRHKIKKFYRNILPKYHKKINLLWLFWYMYTWSVINDGLHNLLSCSWHFQFYEKWILHSGASFEKLIECTSLNISLCENWYFKRKVAELMTWNFKKIFSISSCKYFSCEIGIRKILNDGDVKKIYVSLFHLLSPVAFLCLHLRILEHIGMWWIRSIKEEVDRLI